MISITIPQIKNEMLSNILQKFANIQIFWYDGDKIGTTGGNMKHFFDIQQNSDHNWSMVQFHFHDSYEIIVVLEGQGEMSIGSQTYSLTTGTVVLLSSGEIHRSRVEQGTYQRFVCKFPAEYIASLGTEQTDLRRMFSLGTPCILLTPEQLVDVIFLCQRAMDANPQYGNDLMRQNAFVELTILLNQLANTAQKAESLHTKYADRITPIMEFIAQNAAQDMTLDTIAQEFFITKQHLCYIFKKATGLGINEYLTAQRLTLACSHLRQGIGVQLSGEKAGFRNNSHFIRTFKKAFGISPGKYLANYRDTIFVSSQ